MVQLILYSPKGNQGVRYFPFSGYLGLTPVKVEGIVRTKVEHDGKLLPAKSVTVTVRCYESRIGRVGTLHSNIIVEYAQNLWSKPHDRDYADVGDLEFPFRIILPPDVAGHSTATFPDFRTYWRVEALIQHIPITGVGSRNIKHFELPLIRFDLPRCPPSLASFQLDLQTTKPRAPRIRYSLNIPTCPIGPLDLVSIILRLLPSELNVSIRSASVIIERRIQLNDTSAPPSPHPSVSVPIPSEPQSQPSSRAGSIAPFSPISTFFEDSSSTAPTDSLGSLTVPDAPSVSSGETVRPLLRRTPTPPLTSPIPDTPLKVVTSSVAGVESSGHFSQDIDGVWSKTLTLQWPATKSSSRWTIGETLQSEMVTVKFYVKVKLVVSSTTGTESIELAEKELIVVPTNDAQRQLAVSDYNEQLYNTSMDPVQRAKSKSPRRAKLDGELPPSIDPVSHGMPTKVKHFRPQNSASSSTSPPSITVGKSRSMKRPHTSAGPRDMSYNLGDSYIHKQKDDEDALFHKRLTATTSDAEATAATESSSTQPSKNTGSFGQKWLISPRLGGSSSAGTTNGHTGDVVSGKMKGREVTDDVEVRAWEEEVERIESESRRSTASMFGFAFKRKRITDRGFLGRSVVGQG